VPGGGQDREGGEMIIKEDARSELPKAIKPLRLPQEPTEQERLDHEASGCVPYRAWCRHCVAGRGRSESHWSHNRDEHAVPTICFDYGYLGDRDDDERASPILVVKCDKDRWIDADVLPSKGLGHPRNLKTLVKNVVCGCYVRFHLKCDNEHAIVALKNEAMRVLAKDHGRECLVESPAKGESQSNGLAENAVKEVKGVSRSLKHLAEELHGCVIGQSHAVVPYMVKYAGSMISRRQVGTDGKLRHGKPFRKPLPMGSESVMYLPMGKRVSTIQDRWMVGIYLGVNDTSDEVLVGTDVGVCLARSIKRQDPGLRGNKELMDKLIGTPWNPVPGSMSSGGSPCCGEGRGGQGGSCGGFASSS